MVHYAFISTTIRPANWPRCFVALPSAKAFCSTGVARQSVDRACAALAADHGRTFGNTRAVRTLWERTREAQAMLLAETGIGHAGRDSVLTIVPRDIEAAIVVNHMGSAHDWRVGIGFRPDRNAGALGKTRPGFAQARHFVPLRRDRRWRRTPGAGCPVRPAGRETGSAGRKQCRADGAGRSRNPKHCRVRRPILDVAPGPGHGDHDPNGP